MTRATPSVAGALAAGTAAVLLLCAGCSDAPQSRANSGASQPANARPPRDDQTQPADKSSDRSDVVKPSEPERTADDAGHVERARPAASSRKTTREITFDTLKFDIEKGQPFEQAMLTPAIEKLDGQRVRIRGYMLPSFQQSGIKQFVLVRDNLECCFGPGAALYDCVIVEMVGDESCSFSVRPIAVEGTFSIREFKGPDDMHLAIFHLDGERVR